MRPSSCLRLIRQLVSFAHDGTNYAWDTKVKEQREGGAYTMSDGLKILIGALVGAIVVLLFGSVLGGGGMMGGMGSTMGGSMMGGGLIGMLFWVLVIALIVALVVWIFNQTQRR
jgi:hypothetical protein